MNENEIRNMFEQWIDAWNANDVERIKSLYAEDVVLYQAPVKKALTGREHIIARLNGFTEMSKDTRLTMKKLYVDGDTAILEYNLSGTQTGRFLDYEPTGNKLDFDGCLIFEVKDGKITKHTTYLDSATILRALGLISIEGARPEAA